MAYDEGLVHRVRAILNDEPGLVEKKMFGGVGFMLNGNMACGVNKDNLIVRVGPDRYEKTVIQPHARPFDFTGRPMKGWLMIGPDGVSGDNDLQDWVNQGITFAKSLPEK
jgi:TfoX/Sxy family transcriptional regulator of competence genes